MTKSNSAFRIPQSALGWLLFAAVIIFVYLSGLSFPLVGPDEPRYAQVAREMFERGDWITPTLGGFNWFEKPALLYWLQIGSYHLFGVSEFAARFGSALFGMGTVASLWILGQHVETTINEQRSTNRFSNWLGLIAASTVGIIAFAHGASFDIILTFPLTAAMVSFYIFDSSKRHAWLISFYFFIGLALLAKGLVGIVFPFAIVGVYHVLSWKLPNRIFVRSLVWGTFLAVAVASIWYLPMYMRHGYEFIDQFFIQHHFQRYTSNKYFHPQPFYFFFWVLPLMTIPWLPFFLAALWNFGKRVMGRADDAKARTEITGTGSEAVLAPMPLLLFALAWLVVPLVFFSFSGSKLPGYILPSVPAAVILTAAYVYQFVQKAAWRTYLVQTIAAGTFAVILIAIVAFVPKFAEADSVKSLFAEAHERGFDGLSVLMLHGVSHNAEFYASGRILRDEQGKQKKLLGPPDVLREIDQGGGGPVLVLVPLEYLYQLTQSEFLEVELLKTNDEAALVFVRSKRGS